MAGVACGAYTFGDSSLAARRLALLAQLFRPATARLLAGLRCQRPQLVVDLGCGPGYTTALADELLAPRRMLAIDSSQAFVKQAARRVGSPNEVLCGDVLDLPGQVQAADLIFARFLLTHLAAPVRAIEHWIGRLSPRGVVAVQEVESIATDAPALISYLALQRRMLAANGQRLDIGPVLAEAGWAPSAVLRNDVVRVTPSVSAAAQMFAMNFASWRTQPIVARLASERELNEIENSLAALSADHGADTSITWQLREVVVGARVTVKTA